ncbi:hypothetical protein NOM68_11190 [Proteus mirabilis]|uniref:DUF6750 family protein n=1 Tax=Proteus mirabilis TaxID=584 RepID=UPI00214FD383|nr:DUF6750 family protein [Proteus mirabilis]MCS6722131.1 hypothetical protein [Proteus mirabilis]MCS6727804.1 hypothetical protein [Proteus mirabilis]MCS6748740.1 hypothetical protein [Proteus mirabilis]
MFYKFNNLMSKVKEIVVSKKNQLSTILISMFLIPTSARAEGNVWDIVTSFGDGMKQIREPIFWGAGTVGIVLIAVGVNMIRTINDPKKQGQSHGRGLGTAVSCILAGAFLVGLASFIKISTTTAGVESSL